MEFLSKVNKKFCNSLKSSQVFKLFFVNLTTMPLGVLINVFLTRYLGVEIFGDYQFITSVFTFAIVIFNFGFLHSTSRALVLNHNPKRANEYYGTSLIVLGVIFFMMSISLLFYGLLDENMKAKNIELMFLFCIPIGSIFLLTSYFETLFQADNRINLLASSRLFPKIFFIFSILGLFFFKHNQVNKLGLIWGVFFFSQGIFYLYVLAKIDLSFRNFSKRFIEIWKFNKSYGLNVYYGSLFAVGFSSLTQVLIGYFAADNTGVGFFALSLSLSSPLLIIPGTIATTHYREFAKSNSIPNKLLNTTILFSLAALFVIWIIVPPFVKFFFGEEYLPVVKINFLVSIGVVLYGLADFFNRFLGANGQGMALRNSSFLVGGTLLISSLILIPSFGEYGAAYSRLISGVFYLFIINVQYLKFKKLKNGK